MSDIIIAEFRWLIKEELINQYNMNENEAAYAIQNSYIEDLLNKQPDFALHYSIEDTAEDIWKEYNGLPIEI